VNGVFGQRGLAVLSHVETVLEHVPENATIQSINMAVVRVKASVKKQYGVILVFAPVSMCVCCPYANENQYERFNGYKDT